MYIIHTFCANVISIQPRQKGVVNKSIHFLRPNFSIINPTTVHEAVAPNYTYKHTHTNVYNIRSQITTFYTFAFQRNFEESNFAHKTAFKVMHTKAIELIHVSSKSEISPILFLSLKSGRATDVQLRTDPKANDPKFAVQTMVAILANVKCARNCTHTYAASKSGNRIQQEPTYSADD